MPGRRGCRSIQISGPMWASAPTIGQCRYCSINTGRQSRRPLQSVRSIHRVVWASATAQRNLVINHVCFVSVGCHEHLGGGVRYSRCRWAKEGGRGTGCPERAIKQDVCLARYPLSRTANRCYIVTTEQVRMFNLLDTISRRFLQQA